MARQSCPSSLDGVTLGSRKQAPIDLTRPGQNRAGAGPASVSAGLSFPRTAARSVAARGSVSPWLATGQQRRAPTRGGRDGLRGEGHRRVSWA